MKWPWSNHDQVEQPAPDSGIHIARPDLASILQVGSITGAASVSELVANAAYRRDLMARVSVQSAWGHPSRPVLGFAAMMASDTSAIQCTLWETADPEFPDDHFFSKGHAVLNTWATNMPTEAEDMVEVVRERRRQATVVLGSAGVAAPRFADCDPLRGLAVPAVAEFLDAQSAYLSGMDLGDFVTYRRTMAAESAGNATPAAYVLLAQAYFAEVAHAAGDALMVSAIVQDAAVQLALQEREEEPGWDVLLSVLTPPDADRFLRAYPQARALVPSQGAG